MCGWASQWGMEVPCWREEWTALVALENLFRGQVPVLGGRDQSRHGALIFCEHLLCVRLGRTVWGEG